LADFEAIVVGAGPAGSACALTLSRKGANVIVLEKGKAPGEKNASAGVLYGSYAPGYGLRDLLPNFENEAPLERKVLSHEVFVLSDPSWQNDEYRSYRLSRESLAARLGLFNFEVETGVDYTVLRNPFDKWLADKAVQAGATLSNETTAIGLLVEDGIVKGVSTHHEDIRASVVVDCSGVTSKLPEQMGLRKPLVPRQLYHALKKVYKIEGQVLEKKLRIKPGEAKALSFLGCFMKGVSGSAFLYPNRDTISVGIVVPMDSMIHFALEQFDKGGKLLDLLEGFLSHPIMAPIIDGAQLVEYSAHNIPKGYKSMLKKPYANGFLAAGDALGAFVKIGPMFDGIRPAVASGIMAAETFIEAKVSGSYREENLSRYRNKLAPVYEDVSRSGRDSFLSESSFVYRTLPWFLASARLLGKKQKIGFSRPEKAKEDSNKGIGALTSVLEYNADSEFSPIKVDEKLAEKSVTKPWIPLCPVNCFALVTPKGVFASYHDLYRRNLTAFGATAGNETRGARRRAYLETLRDVAEAKMSFDHLTCLECGTCGQIGPEAIVQFGHERDGHGVRYKYG
jgi:electron transfer flavoprotein-quinone oxidoreductase